VIGTVSVIVHAVLDYQTGPVAHRLLALAVFLATLGYGLWMIVITPGSSEIERPPRRWLIVFLIVAVGVLVLAPGLLRLPPWSEEAWWIRIARLAWTDLEIHPMGVKSDFPSNFQFWPIAALLGITENPHLAARLPGLVYAVGAALLIAATARYFVGRWMLSLAVCFPLLSLWMVFLVHSGWSDINVIPLLIAAQTFLLCRAVLDTDRRSLITLALVCGIGFWTLYTPFVYSIIVVALALVVPAPEITRRGRVRFVTTFGVVISATAGKLIQWPGLLHRHTELLRGGEFHRGADSAGMAAAYWHNLMGVVERCVPRFDEITWTALSGIRLETTTSAALAIGLAAGWFAIDNRRRLLLYLPAGLLLAGLVVSHGDPSPWRATCLAAPIFLFAAVGAHRLTAAAERVGGRRIAAATAVVLVLLHTATFAAVRMRYERTHLDHNGVGWLALRIHERCGSPADGGPTIVVGDALLGVFLENLTDGAIRRPAPLERETIVDETALRGGKLITVAIGDGSDPAADRIEERWSALGVEYSVDTLEDPRGRVARVFFVE
jgi:hypothetical protein